MESGVPPLSTRNGEEKLEEYGAYSLPWDIVTRMSCCLYLYQHDYDRGMEIKRR